MDLMFRKLSVGGCMSDMAKVAWMVLLAGVLALAGCQAQRTQTAPSEEAAKAGRSGDVRASLRSKLFVLKDPRDMRLALLKLQKQGRHRDELMRRARSLNFADMDAFVRAHSLERRFTPLGKGRFRYDVRDFILGNEIIPSATLLLTLSQVDTGGSRRDAVMLDGFRVQGRDIMPFAAPRIYGEVLSQAMQ
jgi:hypothetical protein